MRSKIYTIYSCLSKKQLKRLELFFQSRFLVSNVIHLELFYSIKTNNKFKAKEDFFKNKHNINDSKMNKLISEHFDYLKKFLSLENNSIHEIDKLSAISTINLDSKFIDTEIRKTRKELDKLKTENYYNYILDDYNLTRIEMNSYLRLTKVPLEKIKEKFLNQNTTLDNFYLWNKVRLLCSYYSLNSVLNFEKVTLLQQEVESLLLNDVNKFSLAIVLYWNIIQIRKDVNNIELFEQLLEKISTEDFLKLQYSDQSEIYQYIIGLCIIMIVRKNQTQFNISLFNLYNTALEKGYLTNNQHLITQRTFKNIVRCALNNNQFEWTKNILKKTVNLIQEKDIENALAYNYGVYYYYTKEYEKSLRSFSQLPYDNLFYAVDLRTFLIRLYFELEEIDSLFSLIESFRAFLKRNTSYSKVMITSFRNFLNAIKKIAETNPRDFKKLKKLQIKVIELNPVIEKKWILTILDERIQKMNFLIKS